MCMMYDLGFWDKQYELLQKEKDFFLFDTKYEKKCLQVSEDIAMRIITLLDIQLFKDYPDYPICSQIYSNANCHGTAIYVLWHSKKEDFASLDIDGDIFMYEKRKSAKDSFETEFLVPNTKELFTTLSMPIGIHYTDIFQRHSAVLLGKDQIDPQYYVSFHKISYNGPRVLASFRQEILELRDDICLMPNGYSSAIQK